MNDSDLVRQLRTRDPAAFQCLSERYLPSVWRFVYTRVDGDSHLAEDIVSETVLALVQAVSDESTATIENRVVGCDLLPITRFRIITELSPEYDT